MKFASKRLAAIVAASALVASPALAAANPAASPAASLSVAHARAAAPSTHAGKIAEGSTATIINIGILAALVAVVLVATGGDDDSDSN